jgi:C-terminal processing protease CtpA/Prc
LIIEVDGEEIIGTDLTSAMRRFAAQRVQHGQADHHAPGGRGAADHRVVRDRIEIPTLTTDTVGGDIAYVRLNSFNENAGAIGAPGGESALANEPGA